MKVLDLSKLSRTLSDGSVKTYSSLNDYLKEYPLTYYFIGCYLREYPIKINKVINSILIEGTAPNNSSSSIKLKSISAVSS